MAAEKQRLIKKYPNRRLYDTAISSYITLEDVRELVIEKVEFKVIDARSGEDLTHNTLLQIIHDQEEAGNPMLSNQVLEELIRNYGHSMQTVMSQFLEHGMSWITNQQSGVSQQFAELFQPEKPTEMFSELTKKNLAFWDSLQKQFFEHMGAQNKSKSSNKREQPADTFDVASQN